MLALSLLFFSQYIIDPDSFDFISRRRNFVFFCGYLIVFIPFWCIRFYRLFKVFLDIVTGCKTKEMQIYPKATIEQPLEKVTTDFLHIKRYYQYEFRTENGKKGTILQDRNVCDFMLVRGNVNTVRVLYYSNFLIKAKHGKKELDD